MSKICVGLAISINNNKVEVAAVGDTECGDLKGFKVCDENGSITAGDLLVTSSRPGYLMKQSDDIVRSITIGKSVVDVQFDQSGLATDIYGFIYCG
jgi:cell shape-determining protein MreC